MFWIEDTASCGTHMMKVCVLYKTESSIAAFARSDSATSAHRIYAGTRRGTETLSKNICRFRRFNGADYLCSHGRMSGVPLIQIHDYFLADQVPKRIFILNVQGKMTENSGTSPRMDMRMNSQLRVSGISCFVRHFC